MALSKSMKLIVSVCIIALLVIVAVYSYYLYTPPSTEVPEEIKMGAALSLTGKYAINNIELLRMYKMWIDEKNEEGGIYLSEYDKKLPIKFIYYDDQSDVERSIRLVKKLISEDNVDVVLSGWAGAISNAIMPICEDAKKPIMVISGTADMFQQGYEYLFGPGGWEDDYSLRAYPLFPFLKNATDVETIAMLSIESAYGIPMRKGVQVLAQTFGFELVFDESYPMGTENFMPLLVKIEPLQPDCIITMSHDPDALLIARQCKEIEFNPKVYFAGGVNVWAFWTSLGSLSQDVTAYVWGGPTAQWPHCQEIFNNYTLLYGERPGPSNAYSAYAKMQFWGAALEEAGTLDGEKLCEVIHRIEVMTVTGPIEYDETGQNINDIENSLLGQFHGIPAEGGEEEIIWPPESASAEPHYPKCPWP